MLETEISSRHITVVYYYKLLVILGAFYKNKNIYF
jgi:hypothetical protein